MANGPGTPAALLHQGVKCAQCVSRELLLAPSAVIFRLHIDVLSGSCLQDIVGARFHCVVCDSVDICSNCESVGLPGNLDSSDGGHDSSHIMIKVGSRFLWPRDFLLTGHHRFLIPSNRQRSRKLAIGRWRVGMEEMQNTLE